tara:strand:- start:389 stop:2134 length:1746 start_codon:yes stop_codon:yes gene_type:complete
MTGLKRKLATILATDCVGYSALMADNEQSTLESIKACRNIIETTINEYGGRVFNTAGDSVISEFNSPVDCVNSAIDFQNILNDRNEKVEKPLLFRVGIHLDDVIIEGDDIYGNGVNIAARLEGVCDPGEILISQNVQEYISKKINSIAAHIGNKKLKNIDDEFPVYQISINKKYNPEKENINTENFSNKKVRLLVLPFRNSNSSQENEELVDGIVEDLITEFSLIKPIEIMSNATTASFKGSDVNLKDLKGEFDVEFFLTGSIRSSGNRVRISVELLGGYEGDVLWKERYDRSFEDVFEVQDEIVKNVMFSLVGEIELKTLDRAERKPTQNLSSYENLLKGRVLHHKYSKEYHPKALEYFNKAIEQDPNNGAAYAWKACTIGGGLKRGFLKETESISRKIVMESINKALEINQNDFECYRMLCRVHLNVYGDHNKSIEYGRKALELNPNDSRILWGFGIALALSGDGKEGLKHLIKSYELSPKKGVEGSIDAVISAVIVGYYSSNDYENVIEWFNKLEIKDYRSFVLYFSALSQMGQDMPTSDDFRKKYGENDIRTEIELFRFKDQNITENLIGLVNKILN